MPTTPPAAGDVAAVLARYRFACTPASAAAFLASPVCLLPGVESGADETGVWVREESEPRGDWVTPTAVAQPACAAAARAHRDGDTYLDLSADPATWVKVLRSGVRRVATGPELLWGGPRIVLEDDVDANAVAVLAGLLRQGPVDFPLLLGDAAAPVLVDGNPRRVVLRAA